MRKVFIVCIICCISILFTSCGTYTGSAEDYGDFRGRGCGSEFWIFPESISESAEDVKYIFDFKDGLLTPECQVYLELKLPEDEFKAELERIRSIKGELYEIKYDTENYIYPAYVTIEGYYRCYEYVLIDEERCRFIYIFTEWLTETNDIKFDISYLPENWNVYPDYENEFNVYFEDIQITNTVEFAE